ncbi:hypothetical protein PV08_03554 [Exophiala spinifera]|uniref:Nudix hydrolase domain-containing protein n=1 Tax=Exophiala spinifera TaxID=91928 RepID=A0A0D2BKX9_9EURO|nr:uncharacterized protein PV08_03554 [Exophiala spinifera]KIW19260.1 hypothetical protein PV08_03554 [Exophiala spinifera]
MSTSSDQGVSSITVSVEEIDSMMSNHTMRHSLERYVFDKIHQDIRERHWKRISVHGHYQRDGTARLSVFEKQGKRFNWHRPTSRVVDGDTLEINCFPGQAYVKHNAYLIAMYLRLQELQSPSTDGPPLSFSRPVVEYRLPGVEDSALIFAESNLRLMGKVDIVVLGYAEAVLPTTGGDWESGTVDPERQLFAWQKITLPDGKVVSYLGCMISLWGEIVGSLIRVLKELNNASHVVFLGKAGSLRNYSPAGGLLIQPNRILVTGSSSCMEQERLQWSSPFYYDTSREGHGSTELVVGQNVSVFSPLVENAVWFEHWRDKADWVDCEVFHAATACRHVNINFGYLHIISDVLARYEPENLSNERDLLILSHRRSAFDRMKRILDSCLTSPLSGRISPQPRLRDNAHWTDPSHTKHELLASEVPRVGVGVFIIHPTIPKPTSKPSPGSSDETRAWKFLMGQRLGSHGSGTYALPGGHLEFGETFEECAAREVLEETGLRVHDVKFLTATNNVMGEDEGGKHYITVFMTARVTMDPGDSAAANVGEDGLPIARLMEPEKCAGWEWVSWRQYEMWAMAQVRWGKLNHDKHSDGGGDGDGDGSGGNHVEGRLLFSPMVDLLVQRPGVVPELRMIPSR